MKKEKKPLRPHHLLALCLLAMAMLLPSCSDRTDTPSPSDTATLADIDNAMTRSLLITAIKAEAQTIVLTFNDQSTITINCRNFINKDTEGEPLLTTKNGVWHLNGISTGVAEVSGASGQLAVLCVTADHNEVAICLNDGSKKVLFRDGTPDGIYSFSFNTQQNNGLSENAIAHIDGNTISAFIPQDTPLAGLVASFGFRGKQVSVAGTPQESGKTANDFSRPLTFVLEKADGSKMEYTVQVRTARIPSIHINTENNASIRDKENYVNMTIRIDDAGKLYTDGSLVELSGRIRGRGNSTWGMPKKPYRIKLDEKAALLGMSKDKDWALLANYSDKSLMRNITAFKISEIVGMDWTPRLVSVDVHLNGEYLGVYTLTEHVKVSEERLDIHLADTGVEGDYFMELDFHYDEGERFQTDIKQLPMMFKDPETPTAEQVAFVRGFFNKAEDALYHGASYDPDGDWKRYIDVKSFAKYFIVQELSKNCDGNMRGSCYMTLEGNSIIKQPLVWDFDIAFGNANHIVSEQGASSAGPDGWYIKTRSPWFDKMFDDPAFVEEVKDLWNGVKPQLYALPSFIDSRYSEIKAAAGRNFAAKKDGGAGWNVHEVIWPNYADRGDFHAEVHFLKTFVKKRLDWLDEHINAL